MAELNREALKAQLRSFEFNSPMAPSNEAGYADLSVNHQRTRLRVARVLLPGGGSSDERFVFSGVDYDRKLHWTDVVTGHAGTNKIWCSQVALPDDQAVSVEWFFDRQSGTFVKDPTIKLMSNDAAMRASVAPREFEKGRNGMQKIGRSVWYLPPRGWFWRKTKGLWRRAGLGYDHEVRNFTPTSL